jgi:sulfate permease, SulP family
VTIASLAMVARHALVALVVGMMSVALNISVAAVIYQGPLGVFLDRAIAQALIGGVVMGIASALMFSYRGTICQPQIAMAGVLTVAAAGMAAGMADPASEPAFATIAALVIATAALTGLATWLLGSLRLGVVARFVPFPVLTGFLAATGYLLIVGGLGMALGRPLRLGNLDLLFDTGNPIRWAPWLLAALAICVLTRRLGRPIVFPLGLVLACGLFYVALALAGSGIDAAHEARLLLGPFGGESLLGALFDWQPLAFEGRPLLAQTPSIAAAVGIAVVGTAMSASAFEIAFGCRIDPDRDLRAVGIANLASAAGGGPGGYHAMAQTILAHGLGATGPSAGWIVAVACALALTVGTPVISVLPVGVFATGVIVVGVNLLVGPLVDQRRGMPAADYLVVLIIPAVTAAFGFLWGVATGLLAAALFFVVTFARIDVVRLATSGARLRSRVERPDTEQARLAVLGREVSIYGLDGYIFFGTADRLAQRVEDVLARSPPPRYVLLDFRRVRGLDTSAARALARLADGCRGRGVALCLAGLDDTSERAIRAQLPDPAGAWFAGSLEEPLEQVEEALLAADGTAAARARGFLDELRRRHPASDLARYSETARVPAGAEVIAQGAPSDDLLVLRSGALRIEVSVDGAAPITVAHCRPGTLVGEIGLYTGAPRTARVVAERPSEVVRFDAGALQRMARDEPALLADFHRLVAAILARRLGRTTALLADAEVLVR